MTNLLENKTAVVTGASSGNGRGIAKQLAKHGANVVIADIRTEPRQGGKPTHEWINSETDAQAGFAKCDVTDREDIETAVEAADELGGFDIMVNNAGFGRSDDFAELTEDEYDTMMDVNLKGVFLGSQVAVNKMKAQGSGSIINIASISGLRGSPNSAVYSASKGGVLLLTYSLAANYGPENIRVNAISPGPIDTSFHDDTNTNEDELSDFSQQIPLRRIGSPEDIGDAAVMLSSDLADFISGTNLVVDGGYHSKI